jgi:gluconolactonase
LYIVDTRRKHLRRFTVGADGALSGGEVFGTCDAGSFDGVRIDDAGRLWVAAGDGLHCFDPDGTLLGKLLLPEVAANLTFGGPRRNDLFICASSSLYSLRVNFSSSASASPARPRDADGRDPDELGTHPPLMMSRVTVHPGRILTWREGADTCTTSELTLPRCGWCRWTMSTWWRSPPWSLTLR